MNELVRVDVNLLTETVEVIFLALGMPEADAKTAARALIEADLMGVSSHGVSNYIETIYVPGLRDGTINPRPKVRVVKDTGVTVVVDGDGGMGHVIGSHAMLLAIERAAEHGVGLAAVRGSRHYGAAGFYSMMALDHDMIGLSLTNSDALVLPLFGREARVGTNPIAVAIPTANEPPFLLDMATSTVPLGRVMLSARAGMPLPEGWAADHKGRSTTNARTAADAVRLLPLGGASFEGGGHKGYGLGVVVDVLCGLLTGAGAGIDSGLGSEVGHFFGALRIDAFREVSVFKEEMDVLVRHLRETPPVDDSNAVIYAGIKEIRARQDAEAHGIPLHPAVVKTLRELCNDLGVAGPL